jgi:hypothetical protein
VVILTFGLSNNMRKILLILFLAFTYVGHAQTVKSLGSYEKLDKNRIVGQLWVDSALRLMKYATADTCKVLGIDAQGYVTLRNACNGSSGGVVDSALYVTISRLNDSLKNYMRKGDSSLYATVSRVIDSCNAIRAWVTANFYSKVQADARYLQSETDPIFTGHVSFGITSGNISNWNTSFGWGNHALAGYELLTNKSTSIILGTSDVLFPSQRAVKLYVDNAVSGLSSVYAPISHTHAQSDITGLTASLGSKEDVANKATGFGTVNNTLYPSVQAVVNYVSSAISGLSSVYAPLSHTHAQADITGLTTSLASKENTANKVTDFTTVNNTLFPTVQAVSNYVTAAIAALSSVYAPIIHTHSQSDITNLVSDLAAKENAVNKATSFAVVNNTLFPSVQAVSTYVTSAISALSSVYAPLSHTHAQSDITGLSSALALRMLYTDSAAMLTPYVRVASGAAGYIPRFSDSRTIVPGSIYETSGNVMIGTTTNNGSKFHVVGTARVTGSDVYVDYVTAGSMTIKRLSNGNGIYSFSTNGDFSARFDIFSGSNTVAACISGGANSNTWFNGFDASYMMFGSTTNNSIARYQFHREVWITNNAIGTRPLIVNAITGTTANILDLQVNGSTVSYFNSGGAFVGRILPRVGTTASGTTITPTGDASDMYTVTALAANTTFAAPTGTPVDGQALLFRIKDNGTARTLGWNPIYRAGSDFALPTTTTISKWLYVQFIYNAADSKWDCTGKSDGFNIPLWLLLAFTPINIRRKRKNLPISETLKRVA